MLSDTQAKIQALTDALEQGQRDHQHLQALFEPLLTQLQAESPLGAQVSQLLWIEVLRSHRSLSFWQSLGEAESELAKALADQNIRLQQNYLRLMQEQ